MALCLMPSGRAQAGLRSLAVVPFVRGQLRHGPEGPEAESIRWHKDVQKALLSGNLRLKARAVNMSLVLPEHAVGHTVIVRNAQT